jgi:hypothetical protein
VPRESVDRIKADLPDMEIFDVDAWMSHVEAPEQVVEALLTVVD